VNLVQNPNLKSGLVFGGLTLHRHHHLLLAELGSVSVQIHVAFRRHPIAGVIVCVRDLEIAVNSLVMTVLQYLISAIK
jgi:hypothetical protein